MSQHIEAPNEQDIHSIAQQLIHANELISEVTGKSFSGKFTDLRLLQQVLDAKLVEPEATYSLQALGIAFGKVFITNNDDYDWWMVEDEYGRDPAVRYRETTLLIFPQTMISKRVEDGETIHIQNFYENLQNDIEKIRNENYA
jgi:hypothetical protein